MLSPDKSDAKLIGTATHLAIQNLALDSGITVESIRRAAEKLVTQDKISPEVAEQIGFDSIMRFFKSDLGKMVIEHKDRILREWPFTFAFDAAQMGAKSQGETVIVQGIIDMIVKTPAGLVIIDFKTDDVTKDSAARYAERRSYDKQLRLYAAAASSILKQKVKESRLYFLKPGISIDVPAGHSELAFSPACPEFIEGSEVEGEVERGSRGIY